MAKRDLKMERMDRLIETGSTEAPPPAKPETGYKGGSDQGRLTNQKGLTDALRKRGMSAKQAEAEVSNYKRNTGKR